MRSLFLLLSITFCSLGIVKAQTWHNPYYDIEKRVHFGFTLGTHFSDVRYRFDESFYQNDTLNRVNIGISPGITLGPIINLHITERFDIRSMPSLLLTQRTIQYEFNEFEGQGAFTKNKNIESVYIDLPLLFKYKSERHQNLRFYVIGGGKYSYDIASQEGRTRDPFDPNVVYKKHNWFWVYGCGLDMYFKYFKFSPEIRVCNGLNNVIEPHESVYTSIFDRINTRIVMISFHFE